MLQMVLFFNTDHVIKIKVPNTKYVVSFLLRQDSNFIKSLDTAFVYRSSGKPFVKYFFDDDTGILKRCYYEHK